ncbi:MAG: hypothetical protein HY320_07575, partial [Armatimonadetes bacterium]|nr:hypothetical protein [Armatimonadota bacterium]
MRTLYRAFLCLLLAVGAVPAFGQGVFAPYLGQFPTDSAPAPFLQAGGNRVRLTLYRIDISDLARIATGNPRLDLAERDRVSEWTEAAPPEEPNFGRNVSIRLPGPGAYVVKVEGLAAPQLPHYYALLSSDLTLVAKRSEGRLLVWVVDRQASVVAPSAAVRCRWGDQEFQVSSGRQGLCMLPVPPPRRREMALLVARHGQQSAFLLVHPGPVVQEGPRLYVWLDRPVHRRGESIRLRGIARDPYGAALSRRAVVVRYRDAGGRAVHEGRLVTDAGGAFEDVGRLARGLRLGSYMAEVAVAGVTASLSFALVERPDPLLSVSIENPRPVLKPEDSPWFAVHARLPGGQGLAGARVRYVVHPAFRPWLPNSVLPAPPSSGPEAEPPIFPQFHSVITQGHVATDGDGGALIRLAPGSLPPGGVYFVLVSVQDRYGRRAQSTTYFDLQAGQSRRSQDFPGEQFARPPAPAVRVRRGIAAPGAPGIAPGLPAPAPEEAARLAILGPDVVRPNAPALFTIRCAAERATALFTLEGEDAHVARVLSLHQGVQTVRVALPALRERALVAALTALAPGEGPLEATRALRVTGRGDALTVRLRLTPWRDRLQVAVQTTDAIGRPVPARVFLSLEPRRSSPMPYGWDARRTLLPPGMNRVLTIDPVYGLRPVGPSPDYVGNLPPAVSYAGVPGSRALATVVTDSHGRATLRFAPGNLTDGVLVARAAGAAGTGQESLPLAKALPLLVWVAVPKAFGTGDVALARVEVWNPTASRRSGISVRWAAEGLDAAGVQPALLQLAPGGRGWLEIPLRALRTGRGRLLVTATAGQQEVSAGQGIKVGPGYIGMPGRGVLRRTLYRVVREAGGERLLPLAGSVAPGDEIEVRVVVPNLPAGASFLREALPGGMVLAEARRGTGVGWRSAPGVLEARLTRSAPGEATLSYRLRAILPGVYTAHSWLVDTAPRNATAAGGYRVVIADMPPPELLAAERRGVGLVTRYRLVPKAFGIAAPARGQLSVRLVHEPDGREIAQAEAPVAWSRLRRDATEVELTFTAAPTPEEVAACVLDATFRGEGALAPAVPARFRRGVTAALASVSRDSLSAALGSPVTQVLGQSRLIAGAPAALRVVALNSHGAAPVPGAGVRIAFQPLRDGRPAGQPILLAQGLTDAAGTLSTQFTPPEGAIGPGQLVVDARSPLGEDRVVQPAQIERRIQVLLTTDKPIYQPGQRIFIRALALRQPDLTPMAELPVDLEVRDPKGNRVFRRQLPATAFGVVAAEFQLADEINLGDYVVRATARLSEQEPLVEERRVTVKRYQLPKFKIEIATEQPYYLPGEKLKGTLKAAYFFGKPVAGGKVELRLSTFTVRQDEIAVLRGETSAAGEFAFEYDLPRQFVGQPINQGNASLLMEASVTDTARQQETAAHGVTIAATPIQAAVVPESGSLAPGLSNKVYLVATYPDGRPAPKARFRVAGPGLPEGGAERIADDQGIAEVTLTPPVGGDTALTVRVQDERGNAAERRISLPCRAGEASLLLRADRAIYEVGQSARLEVISTIPRGPVFLDVVRNRQTVLTRSAELREGRARFDVGLGPDTFGTLEFRAYVLLPSGELARDTRRAYINPAQELRIAVRPDRDPYRPGEEARIGFEVTDTAGHPVMAALGVNIVDESVFALQELQPGLERVYFTLEKELLEPRYEIHWGSPGEGIFRPEPLPVVGAPDERRQGLARVLLAAVEMADDYSLAHNTQATRRAESRRRAEQLAAQVARLLGEENVAKQRADFWARAGALPEETEGLAFYAHAGLLKPDELRDAWGQPFALEVESPTAPGVVPFAITSPGPDGQPRSADDLIVEGSWDAWQYQNPAGQPAEPPEVAEAEGFAPAIDGGLLPGIRDLLGYDLDSGLILRGGGGVMADGMLRARMGVAGPFGGGFGGGGFGGVAELERAAKPPAAAAVPVEEKAAEGGAPPRLREYFPETLYSNPSLVTDDHGRAEIHLPMADS